MLFGLDRERKLKKHAFRPMILNFIPYCKSVFDSYLGEIAYLLLYSSYIRITANCYHFKIPVWLKPINKGKNENNFARQQKL